MASIPNGMSASCHPGSARTYEPWANNSAGYLNRNSNIVELDPGSPLVGHRVNDEINADLEGVS